MIDDEFDLDQGGIDQWRGNLALVAIHNLEKAPFASSTLVVGLLVPAVLASEQIAPLGLGVLAAIGLLSAFGDFFMKYATIRAGIYLPIKMRPVRQL